MILYICIQYIILTNPQVQSDHDNSTPRKQLNFKYCNSIHIVAGDLHLYFALCWHFVGPPLGTLRDHHFGCSRGSLAATSSLFTWPTGRGPGAVTGLSWGPQSFHLNQNLTGGLNYCMSSYVKLLLNFPTSPLQVRCTPGASRP